jgi:hypothetical protein
MSFHKDHIFPQDIFKWRSLEDAGYSVDKRLKYSELKDRIGNLQLLRADENQSKLNSPFCDWITTRDSSFKEKHLIPDDPELYKLENFEHFVSQREILIRSRLELLFGTVEQ